ATLKELISQTMVRWSQEDQIQDPELVRIMYSLLRRQYDSIGELLQALRKAYTISAVSVKDTINLLAALGQIRSLLSVRMGKEEELLMINGLGYGINRILLLRWCETFCCISKSCHFRSWMKINAVLKCKYVPEVFIFTYISRFMEDSLWSLPILSAITMLIYCPLCTSNKTKNHVCAVICKFSFRLIRNYSVVTYLAGCGLQSCPVLLAKGYPDIGWNPIEGERYLSFLRFAVFANSESVEENASVVVKLLIR
ncbi:RYR3 protein, partial [Menura novaehollandiae]|nr:RYR3 protein [Menura novaehollandiae]